MKITMFLLLGMIGLGPHALAQKAVLVDEPEDAQVSRESTTFSSTSDLRSRRRVGAGFSTAGQLGMFGALVELNYGVEDAAVVGFGGGPKYNAFALEWKHVFGGRTLSPYMTFGYARWYNNSNNNQGLHDSTPSVLASKFLTDEERSSGRFGKDLLAPSAGLQYNQLIGPYAGTSIFVEVVLLMNTSNFDQATTGALGLLYYF